MNLSTILTGVLICTLIAILISYFILSSVRPDVKQSLSPITGSMGTPTKVGTSSDVRTNFLVPAGSTCLAYIYYSMNSKTPILGTQDPISLVSMGNSMKLEILPGGASSPPKTRLLVQTQSSPAGFEEIPVPMFPQQKWVQLAIVREGRRYTIYYNGIPVSSQRTNFFPVINSSQLTMGDKRLRGEFVGVKLVPTPLRLEEIKDELANTADTRNEPYKPSDIWSSLTNLGCPNGLFCFSTGTPPTKDPLKMWESPYA
jgi:hypothetical protein